MRHNQKAVSPVIATIIIVAVAIVMSIAVAYWMLGLATTFTRYEKLEYTAAYAAPQNGNWSITLTLKNTGTVVATVNNILINGIPYNATGVSGIKVITNLPLTINTGDSGTITLTIGSGASTPTGSFTSGVTVEIIVVTAAGNQYPKTIVLP
ncbi:MAG: archaellin/type IV pilin N-terminal domain-containing protein [Candidatus Bathyarchaeia archaeon]